MWSLDPKYFALLLICTIRIIQSNSKSNTAKYSARQETEIKYFCTPTAMRWSLIKQSCAFTASYNLFSKMTSVGSASCVSSNVMYLETRKKSPVKSSLLYR